MVLINWADYFVLTKGNGGLLSSLWLSHLTALRVGLFPTLMQLHRIELRLGFSPICVVFVLQFQVKFPYNVTISGVTI